MIDKITPRALDKSSDSRLVPKTSMVDALNIFITDDNVDGEGNVGVLKNIKGNKNVDYAMPFDRPNSTTSEIKVIGSVTDSKTQICYFFVWSQDPRDHGVYAYDKYGKLPLTKTTGQGVPNSIRKVFTSSQFNFPEHGFVKGDIVYTNTNEFEKHSALSQFFNSKKALKVDFEKDILLYFTDNKNEPRKINVYRALLEKSSAFLSAPYNDRFAITDLICACPKTPLKRITFAFSPDADRSTNNFAASPGFQFAYQNIYKDGVESAISAYSAMAFPPSVLNRGAAESSDLLSHNLCELIIPVDYLETPNKTAEIEKIRILARYGNSANFFEIDEVSTIKSTTLNWNVSTGIYKFYNDRVASGVSPLEVDKTFDNVPRKAQAQTAISNRLIYGNYLEGYDNTNTECTSEVVYNPRPQDFLDLVVKARPSIERSKYGDNKSVGFEIDATEFPSSVTAGTTINVVVEFSPDKNFHIYQAQDTNKTYHQSRQVGSLSGNAQGYPHWPLSAANDTYFENETNLNGFNGTHENTAASDQEQGDTAQNNKDAWDSQSDAGADYLKNHHDRFFGLNMGVGGNLDYEENGDEIPGALVGLPSWKVTNKPSFNDVAYWQGDEDGVAARYGTSAGNPLILKGFPLSFSVKFKITQDSETQGKAIVGRTVAEALAGANGQTIDNGGGGLFTHGEFVDVNPNDVKNIFTVTKEQYNLGLGYGAGTNNFKKIEVGKNESSLICGVGNGGRTSATTSQQSGDGNEDVLRNGKNAIPFGYFIINKAEVDFYLEIVDEDFHTANSTHLRLGVSKIDVGDDDVMTCFKRLDPLSPWWAIHPSTIQDPVFQQQFSFPEVPGASDIHLVDTTSDDYPNSLAGRFDIPNALFYEGSPDNVNVVKWFTDGFDPSKFGYELQSDTTESFAGNNRRPNLGFCGYLNFSPGNELYKPLAGSAGASYIPKLGQNNFKFSIMDGEGGPGGLIAGAHAAYNKYGNNTYGSIAAKVDFGYDASDVVLTYDPLVEINGGEFPALSGFLTQALIGGSTQEDDGVGGVVNVGPMGTGNADIAEGGGGLGLTVDSSNSNLWRERYVLSGPFFTGSIAMNPVVGGFSDAANLREFPPHKDYTTTLPLIWTNSQGPNIQDGGGNQDYIDGTNYKRNWLKQSYPWPQVDSNALNIPYGEDYPLNPEPFATPEDEAIGVPNTSPPATTEFGCIDFSLTHSHIESEGRSAISEGATDASLSFKSSATHEFGIVYYDERGRHGYVNHLDTVYVEGYSSQRRGDGNRQGPAHVKLKLHHNPPTWAHNYKIVYSKNTSVSDFIQYSAGGAFVAQGTTEEGDSSKIYVSLNYLQGHPISHSSAWGARSSDGSMVLYTPEDGDRLRVVSYMLPPGAGPVPDRSYPLNFDFEISGVVSLDDSEDNPLAYWDANQGSSIVIDENRQGLFLVLKNNSSATGFRYEDVRDGSHRWGDNCIMEMYSPVKELDAEDRLYYEIGDTYRVVRSVPGQEYLQDPDSQGIYHETEEILLTEGDVYFRSTAVNLREYGETTNEYEDLIIESAPQDVGVGGTDEFQVPESNFKSYYLESSSGSDLFKSDAISIGRPNIIKHDAKEAYKEASLIHSDRDITEAGKVSYSSFNRSVPIDMDLDLKNGAINYLANHDENCIFIQKDKCGHVPIDRNIISDVSGESNLIASSKFLNTPRYYAGRAGADGNPESVVSIDNAAYFAHKSLGEVYKISGANGVNVISNNNMDSYFKEVFQQAIDKSTLNGSDVRVVGGYDPMKDEYLITVLDPLTYGLSSLPVFPDQPSVSVPILGCTNPFAENYNPLATVDNGLCFQYIYGCMNPDAINYDSRANVDDNSCQILGCLDENADNYNPDANVDSEDCIRRGCMDPTAENFDAFANFDDGGCVYELPDYTGDLCDYSVLIDESGNITQASVVQGYNDVSMAFQLGDITMFDAAGLFPDFNENNMFDFGDMTSIIPSSSLPIFCGVPEGPDDEVIIPNASLSWQDGNSANSPQMFTAQFNGSSNVVYPGSGSYFGALVTSEHCVGASQDTDSEGNVYDDPDVFASVCVSNGGSWEPLTWDVTETTGTPPILAPNGVNIGTVATPKNLILNLSNLDSMVDGQSIVVTVELDNLDDNISYIGADSSFLSYQGNDLGTQFMIKLSPNVTVSEIIKYKKYKITIDGLAASFGVYGPDVSIAVPVFSLKDQTFDPPLWKNGTAVLGSEANTGSPSIYYQDPTTLSNEPQSSNEDVTRVNSLSYSIEYMNIDQTTDSSGSASLRSNIGWVNTEPNNGGFSPAPLDATGSSGYNGGNESGVGNGVRRQVMDVQPKLFTGKLCDYPLFVEVADEGIGYLTWQMAQSVWFTQIFPQISSGEMTPNAASHHFPNFPGTYNNNPTGGIGNYNDWYAYWEENNGSMAGLNLNDYDEGAGALIDEMNGVTMDFQAFHAWYKYQYEYYDGQYTWDWVNLTAPEGQYPEYDFLGPPKCAYYEGNPLIFTGDLCDYPLLLLDNYNLIFTGWLPELAFIAGNLELPEGVYNQSLSTVWAEVMNMVASGEITSWEATYLFPDMSGNGQLDSADLTLVQDLVNSQGNINCGDSLDWTGSICDYPWFLNSQGFLIPEVIEFYYAVASAGFSVSSYPEWVNFAEEFGTYLFPDFDGDGVIGNTDLQFVQSLVDTLETPCLTPGHPGETNTGKITKLPRRASTKRRSILAKAIVFISKNIKTALEKQDSKKRYP